MLMFYSNPLSRIILAVFGILSGLLFVYGDPAKWQATPALLLLKHVPYIPLDAWGWVAVAYGLLVISARTKTLGYALGAFLFTVIAVSILYTLPQAGPKNIFAAEGVVVAAIYHYLAIRFSLVSKAAT